MPRLSRLAPLAGLIVLSVLLVVLHVRAYQKLSPLDELQHIDYLYKVASGHLVRTGEQVGEQAMTEEACRGIDAAFQPPPCGAPHTPAQFQESGFNTAEAHPPTYYVLTALLAKVLTASHLIGNLVTAGRLVGALWLAGGLVVFWYVAGLLGASPAARAGVAALLATTPTVLHASATINPDATSLLAGGLVLLAAILWEEGRAPGWLLFAVSALAILLKVSNLIGVLAVVLFLIVRGLAPRFGASPPRLRPRAYFTHAGGMGLAALIAEAGWLLVRRAIALPNHAIDPMTARFQVNSLPLHSLLDQIPAFLTFLGQPNLPAFYTRWYAVVMWQLLNALLLAGCLGGLLYATRFWRLEALSVSGVVMLFGGAPLLVLAVYLAQHTYTIIPARYILSLLPILGAVLAVSLRTRFAVMAVSVLAGIFVLVTLVALLLLPL